MLIEFLLQRCCVLNYSGVKFTLNTFQFHSILYSIFTRQDTHVPPHVLVSPVGEKKLGTNEKKFIEILTMRSREHLRKVFQFYTTVSDQPAFFSHSFPTGRHIDKFELAHKAKGSTGS